MKNKIQIKKNNENGIDFGPWIPFPSDTLTPKENDTQIPKICISNKNNNILPRVHKYLIKDNKKQQKTQIKLSKHQLLISQKTDRVTQSINSHRQTKYINFIPLKTRYKNQLVETTKNQVLSLHSIQMKKQTSYINALGYVNMNHRDANQQLDTQQNKYKKYLTKQVQYSRKRSLSQLIKQISKSKDFKLLNSCKYSPWLKTSKIGNNLDENQTKSKQLQTYSSSQFDQSKVKHNQTFKLIQLNKNNIFKIQKKIER